MALSSPLNLNLEILSNDFITGTKLKRKCSSSSRVSFCCCCITFNVFSIFASKGDAAYCLSWGYGLFLCGIRVAWVFLFSGHFEPGSESSNDVSSIGLPADDAGRLSCRIMFRRKEVSWNSSGDSCCDSCCDHC